MLHMSNCEIIAGYDRPGAGEYGFDVALQVLRHRETGQHYLRHRYFGRGTQQDDAYTLSDHEAGRAAQALNDPDADSINVQWDLLAMVGEPDGGHVRAPLDFRVGR